MHYVSSITTDQGIVHYEVYGRGRLVILLHGWLGSWGLWQETIAFLGQGFRTYALDFWGFGESGKKRSIAYLLFTLFPAFRYAMRIVSPISAETHISRI